MKTVVSLAVRARCLAWLAQMNRTMACQPWLPLEYRGRPALSALAIEQANTGTGDNWRELSPRTLTQRVADNERARAYLAAYGQPCRTISTANGQVTARETWRADLVNRPWQPVGPVADLSDMVADLSLSERADLISAGHRWPTNRSVRSAAWQARYGQRDRLIDMLARDYFTARMPALPADVSPLGSEVYAALARSLAAASVQRARTIADRAEQRASELTAALPDVHTASPYHAAWLPVGLADDLAASLPVPTSDQVIAASVAPMTYHRWSASIEHAASQLLRSAGLPAQRPDVWSRARQTMVCRPDSVAFRGVTRWQPGQPCRYGRNGLQPAVSVNLAARFIGSPDGTLTVGSQPVSEYLTSAARPVSYNSDGHNARHPVTVETRDADGKLTNRHTVWLTFRARDNGDRQGWRGHRRITWQAAPRRSAARLARAVSQAARAASNTGSRGPAVGPWSLAVSSLPAAAARVADQVSVIETAIRSLADETSLTFTDGTSVVRQGATSATYRDRSWPIRELARRAALAGQVIG